MLRTLKYYGSRAGWGPDKGDKSGHVLRETAEPRLSYSPVCGERISKGQRKGLSWRSHRDFWMMPPEVGMQLCFKAWWMWDKWGVGWGIFPAVPFRCCSLLALSSLLLSPNVQALCMAPYHLQYLSFIFPLARWFIHCPISGPKVFWDSREEESSLWEWDPVPLPFGAQHCSLLITRPLRSESSCNLKEIIFLIIFQ